jgi:polysaccharide biosynthesis/export protein
MNKALLLLSTGALLALLVGCHSTGGKFESRSTSKWPTTNLTTVTITNELTPNLLRPTAALFTLGPGDSVEIELLGRPNSRATTLVGPDGRIYYSLLPGLDVWGLTLAQTTELLEKELGKYLNGPRVSVTLRAVGSKYVWLLGRMNKPGIYPLTGPTTLLELLALSGGPLRSSSQVSSDDLADLRHSFVIRQGQFLPVDFYRLLNQGDASQNIYLQPDDFVYVPSILSQEVYVLGSVRFPRALAYTDHMTLISAIASGNGMERYEWISAGGSDPGLFTKDADMSHVAILRGSLAQPQIAIVDFNAILKGKALDVRLEPGDIVYVPNTPYTTVKRYLNIMLNTFVTTVAANEGIRAAGQKVGVSVSVPVGGR